MSAQARGAEGAAAGGGGVPQALLDALTDVDMPRLPPEAPPGEHLEWQGWRVPLRRVGTLVVGSGAAGLRAAVELKRRGIDVTVATQSAYGGTSACSGSDKQTLHTANTAYGGDDFLRLAQALGAGGAMDEDTAYLEAVGSVRALHSLQYLGLPLPQDRLGGVLRYQTDHDEVGRATSCGPRTSRLMVQVLAREALALGVPVHNHATAVHLLVAGGDGAARRVVGAICVSPKHRAGSNPMGAVVYRCDHLVLAAGGPGELYRDSVYPRHCFGSLGLALEAGIEAVNLTECQFGIGTSREGFPWNLSGTYAQCMPCVVSRDAEGREHHFLADYYRSTQELASNLFRKGYQWPFHATRMLGFGSSLFDLAVHREMQRGRQVLMDFNRNPLPVDGDRPFSLERLDADVAEYLARAGALQATPIERLRHMNPLSIELYRRYKIDIAREPLPFAMNHQHMNGGIAVDGWARTSLPGCYAVGEAAGTHGVTRPGGAALNAGQVFGTRCAEHIAGRSKSAPGAGLGADDERDCIVAALASLSALLSPDSAISTASLKQEIQARMSDHAGLFVQPRAVAEALAAAQRLNAQIRAQGIAPSERAGDLAHAMQWRHNALASEAVLAALDHYLAQGGGSRGARAVCDAAGTEVPMSRGGPLEAYRFRPEREADRQVQLRVRREGDAWLVQAQPLRRLPAGERPFFEKDWPDFLTGAIYG